MIVFILLTKTSGGSQNVEVQTIFLVVIDEFITVKFFRPNESVSNQKQLF